MFRKNMKNANQSVKVNNHSLRNAGMVGGKVATDQIEGGQEIQKINWSGGSRQKVRNL
jgi:hypothetical protein